MNIILAQAKDASVIHNVMRENRNGISLDIATMEKQLIN